MVGLRMVFLALAALLPVSLASAQYRVDVDSELRRSPDVVAWFGAAKVGDRFTTTVSLGDGCNRCHVVVVKVSDSEVTHGGIGPCTLMGCAVPQSKIKIK